MNRITWQCPECEAKIELEVFPYIPAQTYGDPNDCHPDEGGYFEPVKCTCGREIPVDEPFEMLNDERESYLESKAQEAEDRKDEDFFNDDLI